MPAGRPPKPDALTDAERAAKYRERKRLEREEFERQQREAQRRRDEAAERERRAWAAIPEEVRQAHMRITGKMPESNQALHAWLIGVLASPDSVVPVKKSKPAFKPTLRESMFLDDLMRRGVVQARGNDRVSAIALENAELISELGELECSIKGLIYDHDFPFYQLTEKGIPVAESVKL